MDIRFGTPLRCKKPLCWDSAPSLHGCTDCEGGKTYSGIYSRARGAVKHCRWQICSHQQDGGCRHADLRRLISNRGNRVHHDGNDGTGDPSVYSSFSSPSFRKR